MALSLSEVLPLYEPSAILAIVEGDSTLCDVDDLVDATGRSAALLAGCMAQSVNTLHHHINLRHEGENHRRGVPRDSDSIVFAVLRVE